MSPLDRRLPPYRLNQMILAMHLASSTRAPAAPPQQHTIDATTKPGAHFAGLVERQSDPDDDGMAGAESTRVRHEKADLRAVIAERVLKARLLNGYSQSDAADMLGYGTTAQLSQWEQGRRPVPLTMLVHASAVYGVSLDWLCGVSLEPDRDPRAARRNACTRAVRATLVASVERIVAAFDGGENIVGLNVGAVRSLADAAQAVVALHGDFLEQREPRSGPVAAGRRLASAVDLLEEAAMKVGIALRRHDDEDARTRQRLAEAAANEESA